MNTEIPDVTPEWISYRDATTLTGLSRTTLWKLAKNGLIVMSRQGRAVRLHRGSIDDLMWRGTRGIKPDAYPGEDDRSPQEGR